MKLRFYALIAVIGSACGGDDDTSTPLPCDVQDVVDQSCGQCHGDPPRFGAPISILDFEDTRAVAPSSGDLVFEAMQDRLDAASPMPPLGFPRLTSEQRAVLDAWFADGAPAGDVEVCP